MASHRLNPLYAIKECMTCGSLYTRECCSIGSLGNKILVPEPESSPCCAKCGTPVDGPYCRGCALLRKNFKEDLLTYCGENETSKDFEDISESSDDNTNVDSVDCQEALDKILEELEEIKRDQRMLKELKKRIAEEQKQAYEEEKYSAARRYMLSVTCDDEDDYIPLGDIIARYSTPKAITPDLPIEEPNNSLNMGDEYLDTIPATESDEVIKSSVENLVPIPSKFEGMSDDTSDVPTCDNNHVNTESDFVESLINHDTSIVYSSKIDPIYSRISPLNHASYALISTGNVEADFGSKWNGNYILSNDELLGHRVHVILREKLLNISRLITNIESLKDNPIPIPVTDSDSSDTFLSHSDNSLPGFESFSDDTEETRNGSTTTHANYSLPEYESFHFDNPSFSRPPTEPSDVEICLNFESDTPVIDNFEELNEDQRESENVLFQNVEDDDTFTLTIRTFLPFLTYPEVSLLSCSIGSEDTIFDPGIST
ncbi:hypothetical protein Tco_0305218 [Tanacetum coccineum]